MKLCVDFRLLSQEKLSDDKVHNVTTGILYLSWPLPFHEYSQSHIDELRSAHAIVYHTNGTVKYMRKTPICAARVVAARSKDMSHFLVYFPYLALIVYHLSLLMLLLDDMSISDCSSHCIVLESQSAGHAYCLMTFTTMCNFPIGVSYRRLV